MKNLDITVAVLPLVKAFDKLGVSYFIAGSVASSIYGVPRATIDVDIVSDLKPQHVHSLVEMLKATYYIDEEMILKVIQEQSSFNLIHLDTMFKIDGFVKSPLVPEGSLRGKDAKTAKFFINIKLGRLLIIYCFLTISWCLGAFVATFYDCIKIDIFIIEDKPYNLKTLQRRRKDTFDEEKESIEFYIGSPEDIILSKLEWFRNGEYVSKQQWRDVIGILKVQKDLLDLEYLRHWAAELELTYLLERVFSDAEI